IGENHLMPEHILGEVYAGEDYVLQCTVENIDGTDAVQSDFSGGSIVLTTKNLTTGVQDDPVTLTVADVITNGETLNFEHIVSHASEGLYTDTVVFTFGDETVRKEVFQTHVLRTNDG